MSVEKGVVISFLNKDYELLSWNEQGEITNFEGILTIAFLVIFSCFHKDNWKQLYLIIKIPYMVKMSKEQEERFMTVNLDEYAELKRKTVPKLKEKIEELESKIDKLIKNASDLNIENANLTDKILKLNEEIDKLKKENLRLKIKSGEAKSGWKKDRDMIERDNPNTGKLEQYECPINFKHEEVKNLKYLDDYRLKVKFYHHDSIENHSDFYEMPTDAYLWLKGELPEQKKIKTKKSKIQKLEFKEKEDIFEYLENYYIDLEKNISGLKYLDKALGFLWLYKDKKDKGKKFGTADFRGYMKVGSEATIDSYLDIFIECNIIIRRGRGSFKVNF